MKNQLKHIQLISCFLFAVIVLPKSLQIHHVLTVHHHTTHCTAKHEKHLHKASEHCPIHDYVFAVTHKIELPFRFVQLEKKLHKPIIANVKEKKATKYYYYYLRAPPNKKQNTVIL